MRICHACKKEIAPGRGTGRREECPQCHADLHCCLNCKFYDPSASKQCREPIAELVKGKDKANYCDHFQFKDSAAGAPASEAAASSRKALDDLFKK